MADLPKVYLARAGGDGQDEDYVLEHGLAIIGFTEFPSLEQAKNYDDVSEIVASTQPDQKSRAIGNKAGQLWAFALAMKEGDIVVLPRKLTSQVALGKVTGPYKYSKIGKQFRHTRAVKWIRPDVARSTFKQDLLYSFGAFMTVCKISRNDAERRVFAILQGESDPGAPINVKSGGKSVVDPDVVEPVATNLVQAAHDQIVARIESRFKEHALARLVDAILQTEDWVTKLSPPGPDGGVDILAGRGTLGLDAPRLCVQVKSQTSPADVHMYRSLQGSMQSFKAEQGLLVCWGGFNKPVQHESRQGHFSVRLWDSGDLVKALYRNYERLPAEIQAELPLKKMWTLVVEESEE